MTKLIIALAFIVSPSVWSLDQLETLFTQAKQFHSLFKQTQIQEENAKNDVRLLRSDLLPEITLKGGADYGNKTNQAKSGLDKWDTEAKLELKQTLYNGGREYSYFALKELIPRQVKKETRIAQIEHLLKINKSFFNYKKVFINHQNLNKQIQALQKSLEVIRQRSRIGRIRKSDYFSARAQIERLKASLLSLEGDIKNYEGELSILLGTKFKPSPLIDLDWKKFDELPSFWKRLVDKVPELQRLETIVDKKQEELQVAKADYRPKIELVSNAYLDKRTASSDDWDVGITLNWSLFSFGETKTNVAKNANDLRIAQFQKYQLQNDIIQTFNVLEGQHSEKLNQVKSYKKAYKLTQKSYDVQKDEYQKGLISFIELSRGLEDLIESEQQLSNATYNLAEHWYFIKLFLGDVIL